jgi:cytochrome b561
LCIEQLPAAERGPHRDQLAHVLLRVQEPDGSWWDFPVYDYHKQYGTAFALMALGRCRGK